METGMLSGQVARALGISVRTVADWETAGKLKAKRTAGRWRLFDEREVLRLKQKMERRPR